MKTGGSLIATYETSLYDEWGKRRDNFGLAELFGASFEGRIEGPMLNSYLKLEKDSVGGCNGILHGLEDATRIINGVNRVRVKPLGEAGCAPLTVMPSYPDLPMEEVFPRPATANEPGVFLREIGRGRVVYFPWDIDRTFWEVLNVDHGKLLRNAVIWATNEAQPVLADGLGVLDVAIWAQRSSMTVHLVNLTNPMMMKGPVREIIPLPRQQVRISIPDNRRPAKVRLLVANRDVPFRVDAGVVDLEVPSIGLHEVIALDFSA